MLRKTTFVIFGVMACILGDRLKAQVADCVGAIVICSDDTVEFAPLDNGNSDFANPNNDPGCLEDDENGTVWYYFEFNQNMPPDSELEFTLDPFGGFLEDYDFAIYGPNLACDSLGSPVRCSFANGFCDLCPLTGMGMGATDVSEGWDQEDGFIAPLVVQPGEGFYLVIDYFAGNGFGFQLSWGGSAAPYLNCLADPECNQYVVDAGADVILCDGIDTVQLQPSFSDLGGLTNVVWTDTSGAATFLSNDSIAEPLLILPDTFSGEAVYQMAADFGGCMKYDYLTIRVQESPTPAITGDTQICPGTTANLTVGNYDEYQWSIDSTTQQLVVAESGQYAVTVTDEFGCSGADTIEVTVFTTMNTQLEGPDGICAGDTLSISVNEDYQSYQWSTSSQTSSAIVTSPDTYYLTVTDGNNCVQTDSIVVQQFDTPLPAITGQDTICFGTSTQIDVGTTFSSYLWSNGDSTSSLVVTDAGEYVVTVANADGCMGSANFSLEVVDNPVASITGDLSFCEGGSTTLIGTNLPLLQYEWSGGEQVDQIDVDVPGNYELIVTDENGCQDSTEVAVEMLALPVFDLPDQIGLCEGLAVTVYGAGDTLSYAWSDGTFEDSVVVTAEGNFLVTVTASNGCQLIEPFEVLENPAPQPMIIGDDGFCIGGAAQLDAGSWVSYEWSNGEESQTIDIDQAGIVSVTVTDDLGCIGQGSFQVESYNLPEPDILGELAFCPGEETTLSSALAYEEYQWSNGDDTPEVTIDEATTITLTVTDNNGCIGSTSISTSIYAVDPPALPGDTIFCAGDMVQLDAGIGYQSYLWSDNSDSRFFSSDVPGDYNLIVIDQNGCADTSYFSLEEVALPIPAITPDVSICPGDQTEIAVLDSYPSYQWSTGGLDSVEVISMPGTYTVTVEDANQCQGTASMNLSHFMPPQPSIIGPDDFCEGSQAELQADAVYDQYIWSTNSEDPNITVAEPATYSLTVTDVNGCQGEAQLTVAELPPPIVEIEGLEYFCEEGSTTLTVASGFSAYQWSDGALSNTIEIDTPQLVSVTVTDDNGCTGTDTQEVMEIALPEADAGGTFTINCENNEVEIGVLVDGPYSYQWLGPGITSDNDEDPTPVVTLGGEYLLVMKDTIYGCESAVAMAVVEDIRYEPEVSLNLLAELDCNNETTEIDGTGSTAGADINYQWYNGFGEVLLGENNLNLQVDEGGSYSLQVLDIVTGCVAIDTIVVPANFDYLDATAGADTELNCYESVVSLSGTVNAPQNEYEIEWQSLGGNIVTGVNSLTPVIDQAGTYILNITNIVSGCVSQDTVIVADQTIPPVAVASATNDLDCVLRAASLSSIGSSTGPDINYQWEDESGSVLSGTSPDIEMAGSYWLIVANQQTGCADTALVQVMDVSNPPLDLELDIVQPKCFDDATGELTVTNVEGGTGPYLYRLMNQEFFRPVNVFTQLSAGDYEVIVQDAEGCEFSENFQVNQSSQVLVDLGPDQYVKLGENVDLQAITNVSPGSIQQLLWNNSAGDSCNVCGPNWTFLPEESMSVVAEITDENGCTALDELLIFVDKDRNVYIPNVISPNGDGVNDRFIVFADKNVREIKTMKIFDRWGEEVFEQYDFLPNNPALGWDGKYRGRKSNGNVFVYFVVIEFVDGQKVQFSGDITIVY